MRLIARIDVKKENVIKGMHLEGLRKLGDPNEFARRYYKAGIGEILFMDAVANLYDRNNLFEIIKTACNDVFVPITLGGGVRSIHDIEMALKAGADKVAINTAAVRDPDFIEDAAKIFGSHCIIGSVEAKSHGGSWEVYTESGREKSGLNVVDWCKRLEKLRVGEILIASVGMEGTRKGFDVKLVEEVQQATHYPVMVSGCLGNLAHLDKIVERPAPSTIANASVLNYSLLKCSELKTHMTSLDVWVRV